MPVCDDCGAEDPRGMVGDRPVCGGCMYQHMDMATPREQVERRLQAATDGPWRTAKSRYVIAPDSTIVLSAGNEADAQLAAHAKQDLQDLLDWIDEMEEALDDIYNLALDAEIHDIVGIIKMLKEDH